MKATRVKHFKRVKQWPLHLMLLPGVILLFVFSYVPMAGIVIAFQKYNPAKGFIFSQTFNGLDNFRYIFSMPNIGQVIWNTVFMAVSKIILGMLVPILVALLLNELRSRAFKRTIQTVIYFPYFLSWIILAGVFTDILSPTDGVVNQILKTVGMEPIYFLGDKQWFPVMMIITDVWKGFGFGTIVYLAAITGIDPTLYEAAEIDGASRWRQTWHITLPGLIPTVVLLMTLAMGNVLNAGFDQVFNMYNNIVLETADIIDTYVYRLGLVNLQFSMSTAAGLFKSVVSFILVVTSYTLAYKFADYTIF